MLIISEQKYVQSVKAVSVENGKKECNNRFTISCGERKIIVVIHAELRHIRAHGD